MQLYIEQDKIRYILKLKVENSRSFRDKLKNDLHIVWWGQIFDSFLAGDIRAFALAVLRDFVVDTRHADGISVKRNHS